MIGSSKSSPGLTAAEPAVSTRIQVTTPTSPTRNVETKTASLPPTDNLFAGGSGMPVEQPFQSALHLSPPQSNIRPSGAPSCLDFLFPSLLLMSCRPRVRSAQARRTASHRRSRAVGQRLADLPMVPERIDNSS